MTKTRAAAAPHPHPLPRRRRGLPATLLRAAFSLLLLALLLVALPAGLLYGTFTLAGSNPLPVHESIPALLTSPDQGGLFAWALVAVGWTAWGCFAVSVVVEIPAQLRGRMPRRLPAMGWSQRTAAGLIGAIFALLPATGAFAATAVPATAAPTVATAPARTDPTAVAHSSEQQSVLVSGRSSGEQTYTVKATRPAESLWSIAETHLGSGERWKDIARLNEGRTMDAQGRVFHAEGTIQPGWNLLMPSDSPTTTHPATAVRTAVSPHATTPPPAVAPHAAVVPQVAEPHTVTAPHAAEPHAAAAPLAAPRPAARSAGEVTVHPGDSLSAIAEEYHVPGGWPALYDANRARIGADPDLIHPGEQLALPPGAGGAPVTTPAPPAEGGSGSATPPAATAPPETHPSAAPSAPASEAAPTPAPTDRAGGGPSAPASAPATEPAGVSGARPPTDTGTVHAAPTASSGHQDSGDDDLILLPALGVGGLLAAGLLGVLRRNRILQQRRRPPRRRIPMPTMEEQQYETYLRAMADPSGLDLLDRTLRTLALTCLTHGGQLPALAAVALRPGGTVDLYLIDPSPTPALAPFTASPNGRMWRCRTGEAELLSAAQAADIPAPYPALVTLGRTPDDVQVLADLETVRHLHLDGTPEEVAAVTRALVAELAASPIADHLRLIVLGSASPLVGRLGVDRIRTREQPEQALADLIAHRESLDQALTECQVPHPRAARSQGVATDTWVSVLLCTDQVLNQDQLDELGWVLAGREHRCIAAVTPATQGAGWHLDARPGHYRIASNLPFAVELQRMSETDFASALSVLATSELPPDVLPPEWTGHGFEEETPSAPDAADPGDPAGHGDGSGDLLDADLRDPDLRDPDVRDPDLRDPLGDPGVTAPEADPFYIPVLAANAQSTAGADPSSITAVPLIGQDAPGAPAPLYPPPPTIPTPPPPPIRRVDPRVMPLNALTQGYDISAPAPAPRSGPPSAAGPRVLLLGQVRVIATNGTADPSRISQLTALAALLTLRPDPDPHDVDAVLAPSPFYVALPGGNTSQGSLRSRASAFSKLRDWLGQAPDGMLCLPPAGWRLHPAVTSDWADFQELYRQGMHRRTPAADAALRRALDLVRGRPFDAAYGLYPWAEPYRQDMISAIIDASHELAKRRLAGGDYSGCEAALHSGLGAVPEAEILHRGLMVLYATTGQRDHLAATINQLAQVNASLGCDFSPETLALIGDLTAHPTR
ncbi:LysM peptidoglycan-binding domain-containing protein [Streptacidiphilus sp. PB12-B1b]|uniref:LysM peptidoglycan-binding domain-containing protein n=1 Tax=Streptacidiphilus sp. PB12-B1b TaxID=2705012 RepID=UPI0015F94D4F|nr:LysM peptidoglycan-binding domain-containing protein [Streptacidiphilus sp. PB12-B1b]QMU76165.1 LysM peptidoglycan-binding domain-containing protein [Streptacidiphilus sp. PB12-B1b]